jgi:hypothetical protein
MKKSALGIATALVAFASPTHAAPLLFTFSDMNNSSFQLDSNPVSTPSSIFSFTTPVTNGMQNGTAFDFGTVRFFSSISGGGVFSGFGSPGGFGPQLFSGTTAKPVFSPGTFSFTDFRGIPNGSSLTISAVAVTGAVPEPATWATMLAGFGGVGFAIRRRKLKVIMAIAYA